VVQNLNPPGTYVLGRREYSIHVVIMNSPFYFGSISGGNQPLRRNYGKFNLNHTILIKGELMRGGRGDLQNSWEMGGMICKGAFANHSSHLL
jgi:hypothetical protein